jgi:hypothetical protein
MSIDKHSVFDEQVFSYQETSAQIVFIFWHGKRVKILKGKEAQKFLTRVDGLEEREVQLIMAKVTGNFKRGNER